MVVYLNLDIWAKCVQASDESEYWLKHDLKLGEKYKVMQIEMGSSYTSIKLINDKGEVKSYNSVYLEFYYKDRKINIYNSSLFNSYMKLPLEKLLEFEDVGNRKKSGHPRVYSKDFVELVMKDYKDGMLIKDIMQKYNISKSRIHIWRKELNIKKRNK